MQLGVSRYLIALLLIFPSSNFSAKAQLATSRDPLAAHPRDRIVAAIDDDRRVVLRGNRHPLAQARYRTKAAASAFPMKRMILVLKPDAEQQSALDSLAAAQQNPNSPYFHQWISPERYGELFGASDEDISQVVDWIRLHGMRVEEISPGKRSLVFSGTAAQVSATFHTRIQTYNVNGAVHHANDEDPQIPQALSGVVDGLVSLHDFRSQALHVVRGREAGPAPAFTSGGSHYLAPADLATIYDLGPLYQQLINGAGQSVAIVGRSNVNMADIRSFRSSFGLPANDPQIIVNGGNPGIFDSGEQMEATLDVEWSGAVAKNATIDFVVSASTNSTDGVYLSAQYIVNHNTAPVMSASFGLCEAALGASGNNFLNSLWQQAAVQGITVLVSSGDSGAAGCDSSSAPSGTHGLGVNGLCSPSYSTCVGGTQFADTANPGQYWAASNTAGSQASALSYIPEKVWNESGASGLWSGGGGASIVYAKPGWQAYAGVPADGKRDVPDVSLTAAMHDGYLVFMNGGLYIVGGTSASSPSLAGLMALVVQNAGGPQGNVNPTFYALASKQAAGGAAVFHDTTSGSNSVPGVAGFNATAGYDLASGLGSVDGNLLVTHWSDAALPTPSFQLSAPSSVSLAAAGTASVNVNIGVSGGFSAPVALALSGLPAGVAASFAPDTLAAPGSGTAVLTLSAGLTVKAGSFPLTVSATGNGVTRTSAVTLSVSSPAVFTLTASAGTVMLTAGQSTALAYTTAVSSSFKAAVAFSVRGQPAGMTATFSPLTIASPGAGRTTLTLKSAATTLPGSYTLTITATGGGITRTVSLLLNVPGFNLSLNPSAVSLTAGTRATVTVTSTAAGGFNSSLTLTVTGLPSGITGTFNPATVAAGGASTLTLTRATGSKAGSAAAVIKGTSGALSKTVALSVTAR